MDIYFDFSSLNNVLKPVYLSAQKPSKGRNLPAVIPPRQARAIQHLQRPKHYNVVLLNDDYTPMEFVTGVLQRHFHKSADEAKARMLEVHRTGRTIAGTYPYEVAEMKVLDVARVSQHARHPFRATLEPQGL